MPKRSNSAIVKEAFDIVSNEIRNYVITVEQGAHGEMWWEKGIIPAYSDYQKNLMSE